MDAAILLNKALKNNDSILIHQIKGGMMNKAFLCSNNNKKYIVYIPANKNDKMVNRLLEKEGLDSANKLGISNKNIYFNTKTGIKINEFIDGQSLNNTDDFDYEKVAKLLKTLHSSNTLSSKNYQPLKRLLDIEKKALKHISLENDFYTLKDYLFSNKDFLKSKNLVLCHNDAQRSNIIKSSTNDYYLIDFEFAMNNDEIYDIATFANQNIEEGYKLLHFYYKNPTSMQKKRFFLWRISISLQWYLVALIKDFNKEGEIHGYNFKEVANHFLLNAKEAYKKSIELNRDKTQSTI